MSANPSDVVVKALEGFSEILGGLFEAQRSHIKAFVTRVLGLLALARMDVERRFKLVKLRDLFQPIYECFSSGLVCSHASHPKCLSC